ncbi:MAG: succinate--CoA ligase subunit beta [Candidatus Schekmanbacteria bacterium RIFCSPHIGHO2_02_FULL_38_11]|uniref:Succinate--CoA ligase [ADP-forming] subunit beta n=1 Tax=Candidatus Schekmanbacteria bacterium RIFCSPLOWO2_12_FULL_38_15 TaxID=1817883 RepID=A0A1F7SMG1_9BACT|nr:MAG: succinate--CoA ligase subunit beta [Candidatus Schekmanbacteria bacterium GWA2_38_9]OGL48189.1 MAG: succinate--CoA ligase subunit beta [Candidatus Schekmanbacteria bacterium RIFCSPLOWO2_02_FULL_38_14]OGL54418.1 MAG: succinate--CoA ligase subunit beta [Candidatus Schekmanbacteria bacterium RIFCSPLOWO2_12_FULL_38_15]OGL54635.1 MAG: succinate--CoA ligase subunit beta [Candidatus Schekmanbacteria bacterium RIFCSPHIGHO2_02_FULL_38_11]
MKIHEYQAKEILRKFGVAVPRGKVAYTPSEAKDIAKELGGTVVVKAQIHAGGRGKGGGVKLAKNPEQAEEIAKQILGMMLVTHQTGPEGKEVKRLLIEEGMDIQKEFYLGIVIDRVQSKPVIMASEAGGMEIEKVAAETPEKILKEVVDPAVGLQPFQARKLAFGLGIGKDLIGKATKLILALYRAFEATDSSLVEINPLVITKSGDILALDAKINFDDNAMFRHKEIGELRDFNEEEPLEIEASKYDLNYIKLDGNVGCMVNGAGLAMATMDIIKLAGGEPANFLDVGGGASVERVANAFKILMADKNVKAVLINIFGGIVRCDRVAQGVIEALKQVKVNVPVVVRLEGTNAKEAGELMDSSKLNFIVAKGLKDAAEKVVAAIKK